MKFIEIDKNWSMMITLEEQIFLEMIIAGKSDVNELSEREKEIALSLNKKGAITLERNGNIRVKTHGTK